MQNNTQCFKQFISEWILLSVPLKYLQSVMTCRGWPDLHIRHLTAVTSRQTVSWFLSSARLIRLCIWGPRQSVLMSVFVTHVDVMNVCICMPLCTPPPLTNALLLMTHSPPPPPAANVLLCNDALYFSYWTRITLSWHTFLLLTNVFLCSDILFKLINVLLCNDILFLLAFYACYFAMSDTFLPSDKYAILQWHTFPADMSWMLLHNDILLH